MSQKHRKQYHFTPANNDESPRRLYNIFHRFYRTSSEFLLFQIVLNTIGYELDPFINKSDPYWPLLMSN